MHFLTGAVTGAPVGLLSTAEVGAIDRERILKAAKVALETEPITLAPNSARAG